MSYLKTVKKAIRNYEKMIGYPPATIKMTQGYFDLLKKEVEEKYPTVQIPNNSDDNITIYGVRIEIVDDPFAS